ncbi:hypothetical protein ABHF33_06935 [Chitinibacter sp. FCG-7]|uniref:Uncharacterized protein n=1 Tax=Chitinibacter mangrovi TaxID=3153927 RepID=A0AAU7FEE7_9NEIS
MTDHKITPEKVTKPIQLLAAWLVGLITVNASFLLAAQQITKPDWATGALVIAAIVNVPVFIGALFLLQTKFRAQIQEDSYYAQYLENERQFTQSSRADVAKVVEQEIAQTTEKIIKSLGVEGRGKELPIAEILRESQLELMVAKLGSSRSLAELYVSPKTWAAVSGKFSKNESFIRDIEALLEEGLVEKKFRGYKHCKLTNLGTQIAKIAEKQGQLFNQIKPEFWEFGHKELADDDA